MKTSDDVTRKVWEMLSRDPAVAALFPRSPRYHYFSHDGVRYCWNVEPADERDGRWFAWEYRPIGRGARSGKATSWKMAHRVRCASRKAAKSRALRWRDKATT